MSATATIIFRVVCVVGGLLLLALCAVSFVNYDVSEPIDIVLPIYYGVFGLISLVAETGLKCLFLYLTFMASRVAKGLYYVL
jgi:hypothetical protein